MGVDVRMAVGTHNSFGGMHAGIMFGILFFVTTLALHLLDFDLFFHMLGEISDVNMAAGAGIFTMN